MSCSRREVALNWLALGLLLAAWNAANDAARGAADGARVEGQHATRRPTALRGYHVVSVRALKRLSHGITDARPPRA